jgi:hypothetical protein
MKHARNARKALVVLSDGGNHFSRRNLRQLTATLIESDVQVYAMGVFDRDYSVKHTREERNGPKLLDQLALYTWGARLSRCQPGQPAGHRRPDRPRFVNVKLAPSRDICNPPNNS